MIRKIALALFALAGIAISSSANAQYHASPYAMPMQIANAMMHRAPFVGRGSLPDGCDPRDIHRGGNCGNQAAAWCNMWSMRHNVLPPECFQRSVGRRGGYRVQRRTYGGYAIVPGANPGMIHRGEFQGPITHGSVTVLVPHHWRRALTPNGWVCTEGTCPNDRQYIN